MADKPGNSYGVWDLPKLRNELRERGARVSGRKRELIERLEAYDRNKDFGREKLESEEYVMSVPDHDIYKDLNEDCVCATVKMTAVEFFLSQENKRIDTIPQNLYSNRFLKYIRLANFNNFFFFRSECRAQMKKSVTYKIDVCIDQDGCVVETQCECAAGMGPKAHCKHVCTLLLAICKFSSSKEIVTEETCTQKIQTFHQCKPFSGSPIKAQDLQLARQDTNAFNFDPRPTKFRKSTGYNDYFRNTCVNYAPINRLPISQLFTPANPYAVDLDHDYSFEKLSDIWLREQNITNISNAEICSLEKQTLGQSKNKLWLSERCKRLHSSKFGRICKCTDRTDKDKLAKSLTIVHDIKSAPIIHGKKYESVALQKYFEVTGEVTRSCGTFVSKICPFLAASPDSIVEQDKLVEVKCPFSSRTQLVTTQTVPYLKVINGQTTLDPTHDYYYQVQGQLFCCERKRCDFVVYTFQDIRIFQIERDEVFIEQMLEKLEHFFQSHFKNAVLEKFYFKQYSNFTF